MKNTLAGTFLLFILFLFMMKSCATFDVAKVKALEKVALLSVYCDKRVTVSGFEGISANNPGVQEIATAMSFLAQSDDFNLQSTSELLKNKILVDFAPSFPFNFKDEKSIIESDTYSALDKNPFAGLNPLFFAIPQGYKIIADDTDTINEAASGFPDSDGFMFVKVNYELRKTFELFGVGTAVIQAKLTMTVKDRTGKVAMKKTHSSNSNNKITFILGGVFNANEIQPLCEEATDNVLNYMAEWIEKKLV